MVRVPRSLAPTPLAGFGSSLAGACIVVALAGCTIDAVPAEWEDAGAYEAADAARLDAGSVADAQPGTDCPPGLVAKPVRPSPAYQCVSPRPANLCWGSLTRFDAFNELGAGANLTGISDDSRARWAYFTHLTATGGWTFSRVRMTGTATIVAPTEDLPFAIAGDTANVIRVRPDDLEIVFEEYSGGAYLLFHVWRSADDAHWPSASTPLSLPTNGAQGGTLLGDHRTLLYADALNGVISTAARNSTRASDGGFHALPGAVTLSPVNFMRPSLGCDGWHFIYAEPDPPGSQLTRIVISEIEATDPPALGTPQPYPLELGVINPDQLSSVVEAPDCSAVYISDKTGYLNYWAPSTPCP
jgi:hypothetical protein